MYNDVCKIIMKKDASNKAIEIAKKIYPNAKVIRESEEFDRQYTLKELEQKLKKLLSSQNKNGYKFHWDHGLCIMQGEGFSDFKLMQEIMKFVNLKYLTEDQFTLIFEKVQEKNDEI